MDAFPGNSQSGRTSPINNPAVPPPVEEVTLERVVTGKVVKRKPPLSRRIFNTFFAGEGVVNYLFKEVLVPALQDMATNMVKQGIEKAVYGEVRSPTHSTRGGGTNYTSFNRPSTIIRSTTPPTTQAPPSRRPISQPSSVQLDEVIFEDYNQAHLTAEKLLEAIEQYELVTVANYNETIGQTSTVTDYKYGWYDLGTMEIKRVRGGGYTLLMPEPVDLRR